MLKRLLGSSTMNITMFTLVAIFIQTLPLVVEAVDSNNIRFFRLQSTIDGEHSFSAINTMAEDKKGFIWIGTENGLMRYDGRRARLYTNVVDNQYSISSNFVWSIVVDDNDKMWIATEDGLNKFDPLTNRFTRFYHKEEDDNTISSNFIRRVLHSKDNKIYVATAFGLNVFSEDRTTITRFFHNENDPSSISHNNIRTLFEDSKGHIWLGTEGGGLNKFNPKTKTFVSFKHDKNDPTSIADNYVSDIEEDSQNRIWAGTWGRGLSRLNTDGKTFSHFRNSDLEGSLPNDTVWDIKKDSMGNLWIATDKGGVSLYRDQDESFTKHVHNPYDNSTILHNTVKSVFEDSAGAIWVSTFPNGLNYYNRSTSAFSNLYNIENDKNSLSNSAILKIVRDSDGILWVGTEDGLNAIDEKTNTVTRFERDSENPKGLQAGAVLSIQEAENGEFWIGTWSGGISKFNKHTGEFKNYKIGGSGSGSIKSGFIWDIYKDSEGTIWVGTETDGLNRYDPETDTFISYAHDPNDETSISFNFLWDILEDSQKRLWVGTQKGLNLFDRESETFTRYMPDQYDDSSITSGRVQSIYEDKNGYIWVATQSGGVNRLDPESGKFVSLRVKDGLPNNTVSGILEDEEGYIWISVVGGIVKVDPKAFNIEAAYNKSHGMVGDVFIRNASYKDDKGRFYFGSTEGVTIFNPAELEGNTKIPPIVLTDFLLFNLPVEIGAKGSPLTKDISETKHITLSSKDSMFTLGFSSLNFRSREKPNISYQLEGFDKTWNRVVEAQSATYTNLDPGTYVFKVAGMTRKGEIGKVGSEIMITISPPFWRTWWAYFIYLLAFASLVYIIVRILTLFYTAQKLNAVVEVRTQELQIANNAKTDFLANMSHELRTPLNSIIGFSKRLLVKHSDELGEKPASALESIHRNGLHLLALINDILDISKIEAGKMEIEITACDVKSTIEACVDDLSTAAEDKYLFIRQPKSYPLTYIDADPVRVKQIVYNLLSNAIKYSEEGDIIISVRKEKDSGTSYCVIEIQDSGIGMREEDQAALFKRFEQFDDRTKKIKGYGTGLGLSLVSDFAKLHNGSISCKSVYGEGSTFTVRLPTKHNIEH